MVEAVLPWQSGAWERLRAARAAGRFPHALLLAGPAGVGKRSFARRLARTLLCQSAANAPCDECAACRQYQAGTHPDHLSLGPAEDGKSIPVDAVRDVVERLALAGRGTKVAQIDSADAMTTSAANSLLKTLEEPSGEAALLLISDRAGRLPATIRSRCQRVALTMPPQEQALQWLSEQGVEPAADWLRRAGGAPLRAQAMAHEGGNGDAGSTGEELLIALESGRVPAEAGAAGDRSALAAQIGTLAATVEDLIRLSLQPAGEHRWLNRPEERERMQALAPRMDARRLFHYLDGLYRSMPAAGDALRSDIQYRGLLADAAEIARASASSRGGR